MSKFFILILILTFTASCSSTKDAFKLKKKSSADEFLVEKKNPLVLPPNYGQLPQPASGQIINENSKEDDEEFKSILNNKALSEKKDNSSKPTSIDKIILEKIN